MEVKVYNSTLKIQYPKIQITTLNPIINYPYFNHIRNNLCEKTFPTRPPPTTCEYNLGILLL